MKSKASILLIFSALIILQSSCDNKTSSKTETAETSATANEKLADIAPDFKSFPQYVSCNIDGQPYVAYYGDGHTSNVSNPLNMATQVVFSTSADQVEINGKTKISEFTITFFSLGKMPTGTLTSNKDFYVQGHTDFPSGNDLKYVSFTTKDGQQLTITSNKEGLIEGNFNFDVVDEKDPAHIMKITNGVFKLQQEGKTSVKVDKNGDVNMDSLLKNVQ